MIIGQEALVSIEIKVDTLVDKKEIALQDGPDFDRDLPLCSLSLMIDHKNQFYRQTGEFGDKKPVFLTGHVQGSVHVWKLHNHVGELGNFKSPVTALSHCKEGLAIGTARGNIYIYDE